MRRDPTASQRELARWLLSREREGWDQPNFVAETEAAVWAKLADRLARIFTRAGCDALWSRARFLARSVGSNGDTGVSSAKLAETTLANVIGLLIDFIGAELTLRAIRDVWPGAALQESTEPGGQEALG